MPDPMGARRNIWLPFMKSDLQIGEDITVGHSSGVVAAIWYAETFKVGLGGGIFVRSRRWSGKASGYFDGQWLFARSRENFQQIVLFRWTDDPFLPWELQSDLKKFSDKGHFQHSSFPEIVPVIKDTVYKSSPN